MDESKSSQASLVVEQVVEGEFNDGSIREPTRPAGNRTVGIVAYMLAIYSWMLTAAVEVGRWLFGGAWPGPLKEYVSLAVSLCLTVLVGTIGRPHLRALWRQTRGRSISVNGTQAALVTFVGLVAGAYGTWLFCGP